MAFISCIEVVESDYDHIELYSPSPNGHSGRSMAEMLALWPPILHFVFLILVFAIALPSHKFANGYKLSLQTETVAPIVIPASQDWYEHKSPSCSF
jgi:hypothetical protein